MPSMDEVTKFPPIVNWANSNSRCPNALLYHDVARNILSRVLPNDLQFLEFKGEHLEDGRSQFHSLLPLVTCIPCPGSPSNLSFFLVQQHRTNSFKFFIEMVRNWLVPGKRLTSPILYSLDFQIPEFGNDTYTVSEVMITIENEEDREEITRNLPIIESEIRLGASSNYYARRILEVKGLSGDEKTALIQEDIAYLISRLPQSFDRSIFTEMQHVLVIIHDEFKTQRESQHLSRIISAQYLFRKTIMETLKKSPEKRHLRLKTFKAKLSLATGEKVVLGIIVGLNYLGDKEVLEEEHLIKAIHNYVPTAQIVEGSFFANRRGNEPVGTLYLEIEKSDGQEFSNEELRLLKDELVYDLEDRVEHLMHPVFMPRNEEEVMRNILSLSNQIKYLRDIPQVFITFDEQTQEHLSFTIILVRVLKEKASSIENYFQQADTFMEYHHDRSKIVGHLRRKYPKEATVFRVKIPKEGFLRKNNSIDLTKARQAVVDELSRVVGEFRDFNGGMITKQNELLLQVRDLLGDSVKYNDVLLENFFYSLHPVVMRTVLDPEALKTLFKMLLEAIESGFFRENLCSFKVDAQPASVFMMLSTDDHALEEEVKQAVAALTLPTTSVALSSVQVYDTHYLGYIVRIDDATKQRQVVSTVQKAVDLFGERHRPVVHQHPIFPL